MIVIRADALGLCFGVRDALAVTDAVADPENVTILGELVHNETVRSGLARRGFRATSEAERGRANELPVIETPGVLITAHGVGEATRSRLEAAGLDVVDTTCPLVRRAHEAAVRLRDDGRFVVVIGRPDHVEVRGLVEDLDCYAVVAAPADVRPYGVARIGVVQQTTTLPELAASIRERLVAHNPTADIAWADTICQPTRDRQTALARLLPRVDAVVVVGGRNSNNTRQLVHRCEAAGVPAYHVTGPDDLQPEWFSDVRTVGLTAGTSTLDETIDAVERRLRTFGEVESGEARHLEPRSTQRLLSGGTRG